MLFRSPEGRIEVIQYGIPDLTNVPETNKLRDALRISPNTPIVCSVGRLTKQKGLQYGIDAFAKVLDVVPDAHYVIAGDGELKVELQQQVRRLGLTDRIHLVGWQDDMSAVYSESDVILMPSLWEGLGLVLLEAMRQRLPIVATAVNAIPEVVVDSETGYLVPVKSTEALIPPLIKLLKSSEERQKMGQAGYERWQQQFQVERMIASTANLYHNLLTNHNRTPSVN